MRGQHCIDMHTRIRTPVPDHRSVTPVTGTGDSCTGRGEGLRGHIWACSIADMLAGDCTPLAHLASKVLRGCAEAKRRAHADCASVLSWGGK